MYSFLMSKKEKIIRRYEKMGGKTVFKPDIAIIILSLTLSFIFLLANASSLETDPGEAIKKQIGINPDDIPQDPEEIKNKYLIKDWEELVSKNKILGPVHRFLKSFFLIKLVLGEPYSLSITFLIIFILWFLAGAKAGSYLEVTGILKGISASAAGFLFAVILAQTGIFRTISVFMVSVVLKESSWWVRVIIILAWFIGVAIIFYLSQSIEKIIKKNKQEAEKKKEKATEEKVENLTEALSS